MIARHYGKGPESAIPIGMPRTHWWWWGWTEYPKKDPEGE
jgi:hypothetical protein